MTPRLPAAVRPVWAGARAAITDNSLPSRLGAAIAGLPAGAEVAQAAGADGDASTVAIARTPHLARAARRGPFGIQALHRPGLRLGARAASQVATPGRRLH
ncbi:hypothetical protein [Ideonella sp. A 288]|uniref:hypothetical protein n=1 Tax=Ideonella sp. A 288 TaxID=1962181 RepID=UPI000B4AD9D2|nr:hypothetical protein [Ideonella sp. A 288]